jgi:hypothetical protein
MISPTPGMVLTLKFDHVPSNANAPGAGSARRTGQVIALLSAQPAKPSTTFYPSSAYLVLALQSSNVPADGRRSELLSVATSIKPAR